MGYTGTTAGVEEFGILSRRREGFGEWVRIDGGEAPPGGGGEGGGRPEGPGGAALRAGGGRGGARGGAGGGPPPGGAPLLRAGMPGVCFTAWTPLTRSGP